MRIKTVERYNPFGIMITLEDGTKIDGSKSEGGRDPRPGDTVQIQTSERNPATDTIVATLTMDEETAGFGKPLVWIAE